MNTYQRYLRRLSTGDKLSPRNMATHVRYNETFVFKPGTTWRRPGDNPSIGFIEGLQFIAGTADKDAIRAAAPHVDLNLFGPVSFYGPRAFGQFQRAIEELQRDPYSRRAGIMIANSMDTSETIPCTLNMVFYVSPETLKLECTVALRSSDAVWGLPYDMIQYGMVHLAMANCLSLEAGNTTVNIVNAHLYEDHDGGMLWTPAEFSIPQYYKWSTYEEWAQGVVEFRPNRHELEKLFFLHNTEEK